MGVTGSDARAAVASSLLIAQLARQHLRERGPSAQQTLVELLGVDATNLVAVLNNLEDADLIRRRRDRTDRRRAIIELSSKGEHVLAELDRALRQIDDEVLATLTRSQRETLNRLLANAVEHIHADCTQRGDEGC